eukprot:5478517-Pyramimonas_sp.AAC.1
MSLGWLNKHNMCQDITKLAEVHGHGWISLSGEDLAAMMRTGKHPREFLRLLTQTSHEGHKLWSTAIHIVSDLT